MHGGILVLHQESNCVPCTGRRILNHWTTEKSLSQHLDFIDFCQVIHVVWPTQMGACSNLGVCQNHLEDLINTELGPSFKISDSEIWRICQTQPKHSIHCLIGPSSSHSTHIHQKSSTFSAPMVVLWIYLICDESIDVLSDRMRVQWDNVYRA